MNQSARRGTALEIIAPTPGGRIPPYVGLPRQLYEYTGPGGHEITLSFRGDWRKSLDKRISGQSQSPAVIESLRALARHPVLYRFGQQKPFPVFDSAFTDRLSEQLGTAATFIFPVQGAEPQPSEPQEGSTMIYDQIICNQARLLSLHVESMNRIFVISNIYSHPLVSMHEILEGHRLVSFAGTPIRNMQQRTVGTVCTVDTKERDWTKPEIAALKEIARSVEECQL